MIKYLLDEQEKKKAKIVCNKILSNDFNPQYIEENTGFLTNVMSKIMPKRYEYSNSLIEFSILMDDILDMSSSQEEKNKAIENLLSNTKDELLILSKDLLLKIELDEKEAIESGYCPELMKK